MRRRLDFLWQEWKGLQVQIESLNSDLEHIASSDPACVRLQQIPGVGPLVSTAVVSAIGNGAALVFGSSCLRWNPHNLHRAVRVAGYCFRNATEKEAPQPLASMRAENDQVRVPFRGIL